MSALVQADDVTVRFQFDRQRRVVTPRLAKIRRSGPESKGLDGVSLTIESGETVALLGASGSGKTTLLRTLAGVLVPDDGRLRVDGRVASLLSTGAGLMSQLTGRENAYLLGVLEGLTPREAEESLVAIAERSELGESFELPVSSYSEGMRGRLGFATAVVRRPGLLLLDEVHQALDHSFRSKVEDTAHEVAASGGIIVAAGHDHALLARLCTRAIWLRHGVIAMDGDFADVRAAYLSGIGGVPV
jgi:ABC-type polysaccharide/polyol phosphate transport system ATPase subunit